MCAVPALPEAVDGIHEPAFEAGMAEDCPCQPLSLNVLHEFIRLGHPRKGENIVADKMHCSKNVPVCTGHLPKNASLPRVPFAGDVAGLMMAWC
jgi:hypothetical protein